MFPIRSLKQPAPLLAVVLLVSGCLERKETIRVARDGTVRMRVELKGDPGDFSTGDALPDQSTGWQVEEEIETDANGKEKQHRLATRRIPPGRPLPDSYADPDGPQYGIALMFPTMLEIERRRDGTYYHFKRVYEARAQARYNIYNELLKGQLDELKELSGKEPEELTDEERSKLVNVLRTLEALKHSEYVAAGIEALADEWPQHYGLLLRRALLDHFEKSDLGEVVALLGEPASPERNAAIDEFGSKLITGAREVLRRKMRELRVPRGQIELFFAARDEEEARRAVTEDIGDESWTVRVAMPGEVVAHNGTGIEGEFVVWEFPGKVMFDRDHVLMVSSRLRRGAGRRVEDSNKSEGRD
ncbi:MAG: hypothetical protein ACE5I3_08270 [Phycisphaerae bacterium]